MPAIENVHHPLPDDLPGTVVMTHMATRRDRFNRPVPWLWWPGTQLGIHAANHADQLRGCVAPGTEMEPDGVAYSDAAMLRLFTALGGYEDRTVVECVLKS